MSVAEDVNDGSCFVIQPEGLPQDKFKGPEFQNVKNRLKVKGKPKFSRIGAPDILCNQTISCTSCQEQINPFQSKSVFEHPVLHVILCKSCHEYYHSGEFDKDSDGIDNYCRWCGDGGTVTVCENCCYVFCRRCIRRHTSRRELKHIQEESWLCFACNPAPIEAEVEECRNVLNALKTYNQKQKASAKAKKNKVQKRTIKPENLSSDSPSANDEIKSDVPKPVRDAEVVRTNENCINGRKSSSVSPQASPVPPEKCVSGNDWKTSMTMWKCKTIEKLEKVAKSLELITNDFCLHFGQANNTAKASSDFLKRKSIHELKSPLAKVSQQISKFQKALETASNSLETNEDETCLSSTKESDSDEVMPSSIKRKQLRKRKDLNSSRISSSNENESPTKMLCRGERTPNSDGVIGCVVPKMKSFVVRTEKISSSELTDTGSSLMFKKNILSRQETNESIESVSDIFDNTVSSNKTITKNLSIPLTKTTESSNSESLLNKRVIKNEDDSGVKIIKPSKSSVKTNDKLMDSDIPDPVESDVASDDQFLPSMNANISGLDGIESDSNSTLDDAALIAERNKIALENLQIQRLQEDDEDDDIDEDVKELLDKDKNSNILKVSKNTRNRNDDDDDDEANVVETKDIEQTAEKPNTYETPFLKVRISLSDSNDASKETNANTESKKRKVLDISKDTKTKKPRVELTMEEAQKNQYLSDDDVRLLNKDGDDGVDDIQQSDVDMLLSDEELLQKRSLIEKAEAEKEECFEENSGENLNDEDHANAPNVATESDACQTGNTSSTGSDIGLPCLTDKKSSTNSRKLLQKNSFNSDDDFAAPNKLLTQTKKRRKRIISDSESDEPLPFVEVSSASSSENDVELVDLKKSGRKNIRKILDDHNVSQDTKAAEKIEMERRKRLEEEEDNAEVIVIEDNSSPAKGTFTKNLFLSKKPLVKVDPSIVDRLKDHQVDGVKFLWKNVIESIVRATEGKGDGCILAHCMGLGKTMQVVAFLHTVLTCQHLPGLQTALVICPLGTVINWSMEISKWTKSCQNKLKTYTFDRTNAIHDSAMTLKQWQRRGGIAIMSYSKYRNYCGGKSKVSKQYREMFLNCLQQPGPDIVICDEGHVLKNEKSDISSIVDKIITKRRIVLTGTPLQNNLMEYHCMVSFIKPRLLGTKKEFFNRFVNPILNGQHVDSTKRDVHLMKKRSHVLHELVSGFVQRKDVSCLREHLTPKYEYVLFVRLSTLQIRLYEHYIKYFECKDFQKRRNKLFQDFNNFLLIVSHPRILLLLKARQEEQEKAKEQQAEIRKFVVEDDEEDEDEEEEEAELEKPTNYVEVPENKSSVTAESLSNMSVVELKKLIKENKGDCTHCLDKTDLIEEAKKALNLNEKQDNDDKKYWFDDILPTHDELIKAVDHGGKMLLLLNILRLAAEENDKVVVFSQSLLTLDLIEIILKEQSRASKSRDSVWRKDHDYFRIDGSVGSKKRNVHIGHFNSMHHPRARLFLLSTKAGGIGINLVGANRAVLFDACWNPTHDVQSIFRIYRFGQKKRCYVYRLISQGTMEEKIYERQVLKQSLAFRVVDEQQIERHFTSTDITELYRFQPKKLKKKAQENETPEQAPPKDKILAHLLRDPTTRDAVVSYHTHDSLLDHQVEEELTEEDRRLAWDEYDRESHPFVQDNDPLMRLNIACLMRLIGKVTCELQRNDRILQKCKERPLSEIMLSLKVCNRDLSANDLHKHSIRMLMYETQLKKKLENTRRLLFYKLKQLHYCRERKAAVATAATSSANTNQNTGPRAFLNPSSATSGGNVPASSGQTNNPRTTFASNVNQTFTHRNPNASYCNSNVHYDPRSSFRQPSFSFFARYPYSGTSTSNFSYPYRPR